MQGSSLSGPDDDSKLTFKLDRLTVLYIACAASLLLLVLAYVLWLAKGCVATPFISDFGLQIPEQRVLLIGVLGPFVVISGVMVVECYETLRKLRGSGKPIALWLPLWLLTVLCVLVGFGAGITVGFLSWETTFWPHHIAALTFFGCNYVFLAGFIAQWAVLGVLRFGGPSTWATCSTVLAVAAAIIGTWIFSLYPPSPSSGNFFDQVCKGEGFVHDSIGGNALAICEWVAVISLMSAWISVVTHGTRDYEAKAVSSEADPLLSQPALAA